MPIYGFGLPSSTFASLFNTRPAFRDFLALEVGTSALSLCELRELFRSSIRSPHERLNAATFAFRERADALASKFLAANPGRT
jgi:hypothetical protein